MDASSSKECCANRVYALLREVPRGRVVTYGALAEAANIGSARAVGQILRRNPNAPTVPCHRVIRSDLRIGGYQGAAQGVHVARKLRLLKEEGVRFQNGKLLKHELLWQFPANRGEV